MIKMQGFQRMVNQRITGINIGVEFINEERFGFMSIEAGYVKSYWSTLGTDTYTPIGISFGSFW